MLYLHIGLHKTGTTFLQQEVFPHWRGLEYLPSDKLEYLTRMQPDRDYLLSREGLSGQNWMHADERDACIERLAKMLPEARILISFRRHSGYIASSYNQYLQRGGVLTFNDYFRLDGTGMMKPEDFLFERKLAAVHRLWPTPPCVMLHETIVKDLGQTLSTLQGFIGGVAPPADSIKRSRHNRSVGHHPARLLRWANSKARTRFNPEGRYNLYHWRLVKWGLDPRSICQYRLAFLPGPPLLSEEQVSEIDEYYREDWRQIVDAAQVSATLSCSQGDGTPQTCS